MMSEKQTTEFKSIRKIRTGDKGFKELAVTCVAFANAQGGTLYIGIEDESKVPLGNQLVSDEEINDTVSRLRSLCFNVSIAVSDKLIANSKANIKTTLKNIEPHALKALIIEDLKLHPRSLMSEIAERLPDVELGELRKVVYKMVDNELVTTGGKAYRKYEIKDGKKEKK